MHMAAFLAAGAASCAGYLIGKLAVTARPRRNKATPVMHQLARPVRVMTPAARYHLPPRPNTSYPSSFYSSPPTALTAGGLMPIPRRVMPGQCALCESWFQHGDVVAKLYCGHVFHRVCMETAARQPVYENFRCTCAICHGGSWITRFAVTELNAPREPSVAPAIPLPQRRTRSVASVAVPVQPSAVETRIPVAEPVVPTPPVVPVIPPASPAPVEAPAVLERSEVLASVESAEAESVVSSESDAGANELGDTASCMTEASEEEGEEEMENVRELTFISFDAQHASCTLCKCSLCAEGKDGNCDACGRCKCYECVYNMCKCGCRCAAKEFSVLSLTSFVPMY